MGAVAAIVLRAGAAGARRIGFPSRHLLAALGGLLVEILALVESISGAILAPALEAELLRVAGGRRTPLGVRPIQAG